MEGLPKVILAAALAVGAFFLCLDPVSAFPKIRHHLAAAIGQAHLPLVDVRYRRGRAAFAAGVLPGSVTTSRPLFFSPAYPATGPYTPGDPTTAHCLRPYRAFDTDAGSYRGLNGVRHPCP